MTHTPNHWPKSYQIKRLKSMLMFLSLLGFFLGSFHLKAQNQLTKFDLDYDFKYLKRNGNTGDGTLTLNVRFVPEGTDGNLLSGKTGIRVTGLRQQKAAFIFTVKEIKIKGTKPRKLTVQIPDGCHRLSGPVQPPSGHVKFMPATELVKGKELFRVPAKGTGTFNIDLGYLIYTEDASYDNSACNNRILLTGKIEDVPEVLPDPEPTPPNPDSLALEMAKSEGIAAVQEWITKNSTSDFLPDAVDWLSEEKARLLRTCLACADTTCLTPCYNFLDYFRSDEKTQDVKDHIEELTRVPPPPPPPIDPDREAFLNCLETEDLDCFKSLLEENPDHPYKEQIEEAIERLSPMEYKRERTGNSYVYQLNFVKNPRWKDISADYGMEVDDSRLLSDKELRIKLTESGKYRLFIEDEWGKKDTIELANVFNANFEKVSTGYRLFVEGGSPPYEVRLVNLASNNVEKTYDNIKDSLLISNEDVATLNGKEYLVWVYDGGGLSKTKAGGFTTPIRKNTLPTYLTLIAIGAIVVLLVIYLIWYFRKRSSQKMIATQLN